MLVVYLGGTSCVIILFEFGIPMKLFIIIISIQPEGWFWQEPEPSQETGMVLAHCILGSFLGVDCHCFPLPLDVPTFASRCLHVQATWETSAKDGITGEKWPVNFACDFDFHVNPEFFDMPRKSATWETALLPPQGRHAVDFFARKIRLCTCVIRFMWKSEYQTLRPKTYV